MELNLKHELEKRGLTKADLHRMSGVSKPTLSRIEECGAEDANETTVKSILDALSKYDAEKSKSMTIPEALEAHAEAARIDEMIMNAARAEYELASTPERKAEIEKGIRMIFVGSSLEKALKRIKGQ